MTGRLAPDELSWAHEAAAAGDDLAEIGAELGLSVEGVLSRLGLSEPMTDREREAAALWAAGATLDAIGAEVGLTAKRRGATIHQRLQTARAKGYRIRKGASSYWDAPRRQSEEAHP